MTTSRTFLRQWAATAAISVLAAAALVVSVAWNGKSAHADLDRCSTSDDVLSLSAPLPHTVEKLLHGKSLTIVALGSSSTAGHGASRPEYAYPSRLAAMLQADYPGLRIRVVNRGVGGETGTDMAARIEHDVLPERPDLVIWQVGSNSVLHDEDPEIEMTAIRSGIARMEEAGSDVMLMDMQYAPAVLSHAGYREMEHGLAAAAHSADVPLFHRFAMMRQWAEDGQMSLRLMLSPDRLHMTDTSYDCLARALDRSIRGAATRVDSDRT
jgi:lysophospholipase L1-like esterase